MNLFAKAVLLAAATCLAPGAQAATKVISFTDAEAWGKPGHAGNATFQAFLGEYAFVKAIGYDMTVTAIADTWLNDLAIRFGTGSSAMVDFQPGRSDRRAGVGVYAGTRDLVADDLHFALDEDGYLRVELIDNYNPLDQAMSFWSGSLTISFDPDPFAVPGETPAVPEPGSWAMMLLGFGTLAIALRRSRRRAAVIPAG